MIRRYVTTFAREQEVTWPRELYLNILGCKALVPHSSEGNEGAPTATPSVTTEGDAGDNAATPAPSANGNGVCGNPQSSGGVSGAGDGSGVDLDPGNDPPLGGALGAAGDILAGVADRGGGSDEESTEMREGAGVRDTSGSVGDAAAEMGEDDNEMTGISSSAEGGEQEEIKGDCFVRIHNATTRRDLQVGQVVDRRKIYMLCYFLLC